MKQVCFARINTSGFVGSISLKKGIPPLWKVITDLSCSPCLRSSKPKLGEFCSTHQQSHTQRQKPGSSSPADA